MRWIGQCIKQFLISIWSSAVFRRAVARAVCYTRILHACFGLYDSLKEDRMIPVIPKIVEIEELRFGILKQFRNAHSSFGNYAVTKSIWIGNAKSNLSGNELMQMVVLPPKRDLQDAVKLLQRRFV